MSVAYPEGDLGVSRFSASFVITDSVDSVDSQSLLAQELWIMGSCRLRGTKLKISSFVLHEQVVWFCAPQVALWITDGRENTILTSRSRNHIWDSVCASTTEGSHKISQRKVTIKSRHYNNFPVWKLSARVDVSVLSHQLGRALCDLLRLATPTT
jgi:hypothetical protein